MSRIDTVLFRKRDFHVAVLLDQIDKTASREFADAISRARPSRLDNDLEIEVSHKADGQVHQTVQAVCDHGIRSLILKTMYPMPSPYAVDSTARAYMTFDYENGKVIDQWMEFSRNEEDGDDSMVDVVKLEFEKKMVTNCVWDPDAPPHTLVLIGGRDHDTSA
jgi:hypothetical protein